MLVEKMTDDLMAVMRMVKEWGAAICAGTCEHRKPGELHCLRAGTLLKISATGFKRRLRKLVEMGFMERNRVKRDDGATVVKYTLTEAGEKELSERS
jgi:predicted ArsR family transcriptional regulator